VWLIFLNRDRQVDNQPNEQILTPQERAADIVAKKTAPEQEDLNYAVGYDLPISEDAVLISYDYEEEGQYFKALTYYTELTQEAVLN